MESHINKIKSNIKNKFNNKDFKDIVDVIYKSKEKVFKITKKIIKSKSSIIYNNNPGTETCLCQTSSERNGL